MCQQPGKEPRLGHNYALEMLYKKPYFIVILLQNHCEIHCKFRQYSYWSFSIFGASKSMSTME